MPSFHSFFLLLSSSTERTGKKKQAGRISEALRLHASVRWVVALLPSRCSGQAGQAQDSPFDFRRVAPYAQDDRSGVPTTIEAPPRSP